MHSLKFTYQVVLEKSRFWCKNLILHKKIADKFWMAQFSLQKFAGSVGVVSMEMGQHDPHCSNQ